MDDHAHAWGLSAASIATPMCPVNVELLGALLGAARDGCFPCKLVYVRDLVTDPRSTARLVELTCITLVHAYGLLPPACYDDNVPSPASPEFKRLARAGLYDLGGLYRESELLSPQERNEAAWTAVISFVTSVDVMIEDGRAHGSRHSW